MEVDLIINGATETGDFATVGAILKKYDLLPQNVVVELNGKILDKAEYDTRQLKEGDAVELIQFVAGG